VISLCMIVKNEGKNLEKALDSIVNYIEDIVIVDTGSIDNTKEIAKKYTDKVYDFKWCNDFSKARNFSISKAANDWVLILDADEFVCKFDKEKIENFINNNNKTIGRIKRINPFEDGKEIRKYIERVNRLFNKKYFNYEGIIHEQVVSKDNKQYRMNAIEIEVYHIGYLKEVINKTNKLERNINLLIESINSNPNDPYLYYQIGKSYYLRKDYNKACYNFNKSLELCTDFKFEYTEDLVESYGYTLLKSEKYDKAMELIDYKEYYGNSPDFNFIVGLIYMNNGKLKEAIESFNKCIGEKEGKFEGINSYQPNYNIGVIYETVGLKEVALEYYHKCGGYIPAEKRIKIMIEENKFNIIEIKKSIERCIQDQDLEGAKKLIGDCLKVENKDIEVYSMKAVVEIMENRLEDAEETLKYSLEIDDKNFDILYNLGYLYELKKKYKLSVDFYSKALILCESKEMKNQLEDYIKDIKIKKFKTSIIILTYNNLDYNKICIESIKKYTNCDYEIIVVDNHSTDGTVEWLETQEDIKVIYNKENLGFPKGCNQGIRIANGEEILLLNNDTIVTPNWLENLKECLYSSEEVAAVGPVTNSCPNYQTIPIDYKSVEEMIVFAEKYNINEAKKWEEKLRLIGYCMLIKKDIVDEIGLLDERFTPGNFEDDDYSLRIRRAGYKLMLCKNSFIHHFGSLSFGEVSNDYSELLKRNRGEFFEKWGLDPYKIIDIEKEALDVIIEKSNINNLAPNILHLGCSGGATLLKVKGEIPNANLYGVEKIRELVVGTDDFAIITNNELELRENYGEVFFDYIIVSESYYNNKEVAVKSRNLVKYLKENGTLIIMASEKNKMLVERIESSLKQSFNLVYRKNKKSEKEDIIIASDLIKSQKESEVLSLKDDYLSIIITVAKNDDNIDDCINSIKSLSIKENCEVIVINYGKERQLNKLKEYIDNINIIESDMAQGYANAVNYAISISRGRDILFIHSDVIITDASIEKLKQCLYNNKNIGAVAPITDSNNKNVNMKLNTYKNIIDFSKKYSIKNGSSKEEEKIRLDSFCILMKKEVITKCGELCDSYISDIYTMDDYLFKVRISGFKLLLCKDAFVYHYGNYHLFDNLNDINKNLLMDEESFKNKWGFNISYSSIVRDEIIDLIDQEENNTIRVLEVGCACGATLLQIKNKYRNAELHGIELNENAARIAKLCASVTAENIENNILSYEKEYFDYIIFADVLEHLKKPEVVLKNIRKYLKADGKVLASIPNVMHFSVIRDLLNQRWEYKDWGILDRTHYRFFTLKEIEKMFANTGYDITEVKNKFFNQNTEDDIFIESLLNLTKKDLSLQYKTLQYIIKASMNNAR